MTMQDWDLALLDLVAAEEKAEQRFGGSGGVERLLGADLPLPVHVMEAEIDRHAEAISELQAAIDSHQPVLPLA